MSLSRPMRVAVVLVPILATGVVVYSVLWALDVRKRGRAQSELPVLAEVPPFTLVERSGKRVGKEDLLGRVWIADFFFTNCSGPCVLMTTKMTELQESLRKAKDVMLVSFSVDPARDTPEVLSRYADAHGAKPDRWWMLTGDEGAIRKLAIEGFKLGTGEGSDSRHAILHSTRFVVVDRRGRIRSFRDATEPDSHARVLRDVELVLSRERD